MTDKEQLQRLFDAALKDTSELNKAPTRAFPSPVFRVPPASAPVIEPILASMPVAVENMEMTTREVPLANAGLDDATSTELGAVLDEQRARLKRRHFRQAIATLTACLSLTGGGVAWFVQSPVRVQAFQDAVKDIRSVGDSQSLVAKYQASLDRIAARSQQIDHATTAMDVEPCSGAGEDPYFNAEMQEMRGEKGKAVGQRNSAPLQSFDPMKKDSGHTAIPVSKLSQADSFE